LEVRLFYRKSFVDLTDGDAPIDHYMSTNFSMQLDTTVAQSANIFLRPSQLIKRHLYRQDEIVETFTVSEANLGSRQALSNFPSSEQSSLASISFRLDSQKDIIRVGGGESILWIALIGGFITASMIFGSAISSFFARRAFIFNVLQDLFFVRKSIIADTIEEIRESHVRHS
jgi:hypothetical protein